MKAINVDNVRFRPPLPNCAPPSENEPNYVCYFAIVVWKGGVFAPPTPSKHFCFWRLHVIKEGEVLIIIGVGGCDVETGVTLRPPYVPIGHFQTMHHFASLEIVRNTNNNCNPSGNVIMPEPPTTEHDHCQSGLTPTVNLVPCAQHVRMPIRTLTALRVKPLL